MKLLDAISDLGRNLQSRIHRPRLERGERQAHVVAVAAQKGGVGKTTTTVNLATALALHHRRRVLVLDLDAQGHVGMSLRRVAEAAPRGTERSERLGELLLQRGRDVQELACPTRVDSLWTVASDCQLNATEAVMAGRIGKELLLNMALSVARTHHDVILIDCPPALGGLTVNGLVAARHVLVPCDLSVLSLDGVEALLETVAVIRDTLNPDLDLLGLVRTRVDRRNQRVNAAIEQSLERRYARWMLETCVGVSTEFNKAQIEGQPVALHAPRGRAAAFYRDLAAEVDARLFSSAA